MTVADDLRHLPGDSVFVRLLTEKLLFSPLFKLSLGRKSLNKFHPSSRVECLHKIFGIPCPSGLPPVLICDVFDRVFTPPGLAASSFIRGVIAALSRRCCPRCSGPGYWELLQTFAVPVPARCSSLPGAVHVSFIFMLLEIHVHGTSWTGAGGGGFLQ